MSNVADRVLREIRERMSELKPRVDEYEQLLGTADSMGVAMPGEPGATTEGAQPWDYCRGARPFRV